MHIWPTLLASLEPTLLKIIVSGILEKYASSVSQNLLCWDRHLCIPVLASISVILCCNVNIVKGRKEVICSNLPDLYYKY